MVVPKLAGRRLTNVDAGAACEALRTDLVHGDLVDGGLETGGLSRQLTKQVLRPTLATGSAAPAVTVAAATIERTGACDKYCGSMR
jgi:hypothetical protein